MEDARKARLRNGLKQLNSEQLQQLLDAAPETIVTDEYYYHDGKY